MTTGVNKTGPLFLWRKFATVSRIDRYEQKLRERVADRLAIVIHPGRPRGLLEIVCQTRAEAADLVKIFGGSVTRLPSDWQRRALSASKPKPLKIRGFSLFIPAGAAFGTGEHATTAMSLRLLERLACDWEPGWALLDLGTGSGILALAAKRLGARRVVGVDIDPLAISTAKENARLNKIAGVQFALSDVRSWKLGPPVDVTTANLFSELLIKILPKLHRSCWLILSGILREQEADVTRGLRQTQREIVKVQRRGKWVAIMAKSIKTDCTAPANS